jgi:hypothetical protein
LDGRCEPVTVHPVTSIFIEGLTLNADQLRSTADYKPKIPRSMEATLHAGEDGLASEEKKYPTMRN